MANQTLTQDEFLEYVRAFNKPDYSKQHSFYTEDVELILPDPAIGTLEGKTAIAKHYDGVHAAAQETVVPISVKFDEYSNIHFEMETYFRYTRATDAAIHSMTVKEGDVIRIRCGAKYEMQGKKMKRITCTLHDETFLGQVDMSEVMKESERKAEPGVRLNTP